MERVYGAIRDQHDAAGAGESHEETECKRSVALGTDRLIWQQRPRHDPYRIPRKVGSDVGLFQTGQDRIVKGAVGFSISRQHRVGYGKLV